MKFFPQQRPRDAPPIGCHWTNRSLNEPATMRKWAIIFRSVLLNRTIVVDTQLLIPLLPMRLALQNTDVEVVN